METDSSTIIKGHFRFDPEDPIFRDHFPGRSVVPGSLIIHAFVKALDRSCQGAAPRSITNFRFKRFVSPGCYAFRIESKSDGRMACSLYDEDRILVTGTL